MGEYDAYHSGISGGCIPAGGRVGGAPAWRAPAWRAHAPLFAGLEGTPAWDARARPLSSERAGARRRPVPGGARRRLDAGGTERWQPGRSTREGAERRTVQVGEGRRRSGDRDRPGGVEPEDKVSMG